MPDRFDGAPYAMKVARTVWAQGKGGDNFKPLPMGSNNFLYKGTDASHKNRRT